MGINVKYDSFGLRVLVSGEIAELEHIFFEFAEANFVDFGLIKIVNDSDVGGGNKQKNLLLLLINRIIDVAETFNKLRHFCILENQLHLLTATANIIIIIKKM